MKEAQGLSKKDILLHEFNQKHSAGLNKHLGDKIGNKYFVEDVSMLIPSMKYQAVDLNMIQNEVDEYMNKISWTDFSLMAEIAGLRGYILRPIF